MQPIYVDDLPGVATEKVGGVENETLEAIGPETFSYRELVDKVGEAIGIRRRIVSVSPGVGYIGCRLVGCLVMS